VTGVIGGSGGTDIIPAVTQVILNVFVLGMDPLSAVQSPRVYHKVHHFRLCLFSLCLSISVYFPSFLQKYTDISWGSLKVNSK